MITVRGIFGTFFLLWFLPAPLFAQVVISEIMYDHEGSDSGREWVEIANEGAATVDLTGWTFFENDTNHKMEVVHGDISLSAGEYAVIADDAEQFIAEWTAFSGILIDSSFSLKNTGEHIALKDANGAERSSVAYHAEWGASGDGNSLQRLGGDWGAALPTPGFENAAQMAANDKDYGQKETAEKSVRQFPVEPQIFAHIKDNAAAIVGADSVFEGVAIGLLGEPIDNARFIWNFGNGVSKEGKSVPHHYDYPGTYIVVLDVASGEYAASDRVTVVAKESPIAIADASPEFITLENSGAREIDVSRWFVRGADNQHFQFPSGTILPSGETVRFSSHVTGVYTKNTDIVSLLYPNGMIADTYVWEESVVRSVAPQSEGGDVSPIAREQIPSETENPSEVKEVREQAAAAVIQSSLVSAQREDGGNTLMWIAGIIGLVFIAIVSVFLVRKEDDERIRIIE